MRGGRFSSACALLLSLVVARHSAAVVGALDQTPGASVLFPYFEVDLGDDQGVTTLLALQNASATANLTRWTLWTDLGLPTLSFDTYQTGFDVTTINLRSLFVDGFIPQTASDGQDPMDTISPQGPFSQDINFATCSGQLPPLNAAVVGSTLTDLRAAHTGLESPTFFTAGRCGGFVHGDNIARGYVTVDSMIMCQGVGLGPNPTTASYFTTTWTGNTLIGDFFFVHPARNLMETEAAVPLEAPIPAFTPGTPTFYGNLNPVFGSAADNREPLATTWAASVRGQASDLVVWRDGRNIAPFVCGTTPFNSSFDQTQIVGFDMESTGAPVIGEQPFTLRTNRTAVGPATGLDMPRDGWAYLNLNHPGLGSFPGGVKQSWVVGRRVLEGAGLMSIGVTAMPLGKVAAGDNPVILPNP